jgi:hypothetical protein
LREFAVSIFIDLDSQRLVRFDEVIPSLKEVDGMRMYLDVLAAVHASGNKPSQGIADSEIKPFYVRSVDFATGFNAKGFHDFNRISKYDTLGNFYNSTLFFSLAYIAITFRITINNVLFFF